MHVHGTKSSAQVELCRGSAKLRHRGCVPAPQSVIRLAPRVYQQTEARASRHSSATARNMYGDLIEEVNSETPDESTSTRLRAKELANALSHLSPRVRCVLALRFGLDGETPQTLEEVGVGLGVTRERVRQLESRALRELRIAAPDLALYLRAE
jgi:RNA polymerase sigma factor (sigma-70 family)